jgi:hypothetical protein
LSMLEGERQGPSLAIVLKKKRRVISSGSGSTCGGDKHGQQLDIRGDTCVRDKCRRVMSSGSGSTHCGDKQG